jgi:hypothetical protein
VFVLARKFNISESLFAIRSDVNQLLKSDGQETRSFAHLLPGLAGVFVPPCSLLDGAAEQVDSCLRLFGFHFNPPLQ